MALYLSVSFAFLTNEVFRLLPSECVLPGRHRSDSAELILTHGGSPVQGRGSYLGLRDGQGPLASTGTRAEQWERSNKGRISRLSLPVGKEAGLSHGSSSQTAGARTPPESSRELGDGRTNFCGGGVWGRRGHAGLRAAAASAGGGSDVTRTLALFCSAHTLVAFSLEKSGWQ